MDKPLDKKSNTPYNNRGFHTKNYTQDMRKDQFSSKLDTPPLALTTQETPTGESGLPMLH